MKPVFFAAPPQPEVAIPWDEVSPVQGIDGTAAIYNMPPGTAVYLYGMVPSGYGCLTQPGYRVWAQNLAGGAVKSVVPFLGQIGDFSQRRLFAVTQNGIYDVTAQGADNPTAVVTFPSQLPAAGFCSSLHFTDPNGSQTLLLADSLNGLYEYNPVGAIWTKYTTEITFPDATTPNDISFITTHKGRIWLVGRNNADAYYLPVGAKGGVATKFQFGSKMERGGYLVGLWGWSVDGGNGLDDYLIAIGKGGDILVYQGTDPATASTWSMVGRWYIGQVPEGRRIAEEVGGDLILLSSVGLTSTSALLNGIDPTRVERNVTGKITRIVRDAVSQKIDLPYWQVVLLPEESQITINTPKKANERYIQFALNTNRVAEGEGGGWGFWRDAPATMFTSFANSIFFGTEEGQVCRMEGSLNNVLLNGTGGTAVEFSALTRFTNLGAPGIYKQVQFSRPVFVTDNVVQASCRTVYDYNLSEANLATQSSPRGGALWDTATWDRALWSGTFSERIICGGRGYGVQTALQLQGNTVARATLAHFEGTFVPWKFL